MLGDIVTPRPILIVPPAGEGLAKDGIERFLHSGRLDVPAAQVELGDRYKASHGVVDGGDGEEDLGVGHEVGDALQHALRLEDEGGQSDAGEVGAGAELADDVLEDVALLARHHRLVLVRALLRAVPPAAQRGAAVPVAQRAEARHCGDVWEGKWEEWVN